jgi:hypothetical protein
MGRGLASAAGLEFIPGVQFIFISSFFFSFFFLEKLF